MVNNGIWLDSHWIAIPIYDTDTNHIGLTSTHSSLAVRTVWNSTTKVLRSIIGYSAGSAA